MKKLRRIAGIVVSCFVVLSALWAVGMMIWAQRVERPAGLGVSNGKLAACPSSPNCVSSLATLETQQMPALRYQGTEEEATARLRQVVESMAGVSLFEEKENYLAYVFRSRLIGFPDDVEFLFDDANKQIHFRSASRLGQGDLGVNRARMEKITQLFSGNN